MIKKISPQPTYVFRRIRPTSNACPACRKEMFCMEKIPNSTNLIYVCNNPKCSLKLDVNNLKKSGWQIHKK